MSIDILKFMLSYIFQQNIVSTKITINHRVNYTDYSSLDGHVLMYTLSYIKTCLWSFIACLLLLGNKF